MSTRRILIVYSILSGGLIRKSKIVVALTHNYTQSIDIAHANVAACHGGGSASGILSRGIWKTGDSARIR